MPATPMQAVNLNMGAGTLYAAPVGTVEPVDNTTAWNAAWIKIGFTKEGHTLKYELTTEGIMVAEEIEPVLFENTKLMTGVQFAMAELIGKNLVLAMSGGTLVTGAASTTYTPPNPGLAPPQVALAWESRDASERWIWRRCVQTGPVEIKRAKAPDYATIPVAFSVVKPPTGASFVAIVTNARG